MAKIVINGKLYAQRTTGVQRYSRELILELDNLVSGMDVEIALPKNAVDVPDLKNIKLHYLGGNASIFWEQVILPLYILKERAVGLHVCSIVPIVKPDLVILYDANALRNPQWFTKKLVAWYRMVHGAAAKHSKAIFTDSDFAKEELWQIFNINGKPIKNIGAGWQHLERVPYDENALQKHNLRKGDYFFCLGTRAPHKNMRWVCDHALKYPEENFAISGSMNSKIFGNEQIELPANVHFLGYLSDSEIKTLMRDSKAFLFPSFYEGFGLPPLEAMSTGCPIIVSDIPVMHENFGDAAHYIDPNNADVDLNRLLKNPVAASTPILEKYSWKNCALKMYDKLKEFG